MLKAGNEISQWELFHADELENLIEWRQGFWSGFGVTKVRVYLKETRKKSTLATIYINRPLQPIDPMKMFEKINAKLEKKLDQNLKEMAERNES